MKIERIQHPETAAQNERNADRIIAGQKKTVTSRAISFDDRKREDPHKEKEQLDNDKSQKLSKNVVEEEEESTPREVSSSVDVVA